MSRFVFAATLAIATAAVAAQSAPPQSPQQASPHATITGCLQRAPSSLEKDGRYVLMNASNSPLGGSPTQDTAPSTTPPPPPPRGHEPVERRQGEADARQETGGVSYLLQGGSDLESKVGQRVEVTGTIGSEVQAPATRFTLKQPIRKVQVTNVRAIKSSC